jgi:CheY-like chemotaxis protein
MANVLIVDDDLDTVEVCAELLESSGHWVLKRCNGHEGLVSLDAGLRPDCVLLDVDMPVLNGPAMAHKMHLHDGQETIPIVLVSARMDLADIARHVGTPYFLTKACADYGNRLLALLDRALREKLAPNPS